MKDWFKSPPPTEEDDQSTVDHGHHHSSSSSETIKGEIRGEAHLRWLILFLSCWIMFGNYYAFDNPSALNIPLRNWLASPGDLVTFQYRLSLLYSVYSIPNVILPFFVGRAIDRLGSRSILLILALLVALGQMLTAIGLQKRNFGLLLLGRTIFGVGGESLAVAQARLVTHWFVGKELALAIGLNLSIARIGTVVNNVLSPLVARRHSVPAAFWLGFASCVVSFGCTLATVVLDRCYRDEALPELRKSRRKIAAAQCDSVDPLSVDSWPRSPSVGKARKAQEKPPRSPFDPGFWVLAIICFLFYVRHPPMLPVYLTIDLSAGLHGSLQQCGIGLPANALL